MSDNTRLEAALAAQEAQLTQLIELQKEMKARLEKQGDEITQLKIQLAHGSGAVKFVMIAGSVVALLIGLSKLLPVSGG